MNTLAKITIICLFALVCVLSTTIIRQSELSAAENPNNEKPKYLDVYIEKDGKRHRIGRKTKPEKALILRDNKFAIVTYGIDLNIDMLHPCKTVGVQQEGSDMYWYVNIEVLDMKEHYFRYAIPSGLNDGLYLFFIKSRAMWGEKDKYYFRIETAAK